MLSQKLWPRPVLSASKKEAIVPYGFHKKPEVGRKTGLKEFVMILSCT